VQCHTLHTLKYCFVILQSYFKEEMFEPHRADELDFKAGGQDQKEMDNQNEKIKRIFNKK
jgi:hypothetical protein